MRRTLLVVAALVTLVAVAGFGVAYASRDDKTIRLRAKTTGFHQLDQGDKGPSAFDQFIETSDLFDRSGNKVGHEVGHEAVNCVVVRPGEVLCTASAVLGRGQILSVGLVQIADVTPGGEFSVAVVGGTGVYRDAAGEWFVKVLPGGEADITIHLE